MSVGQVIQLDVVDEKHSRLLQDGSEDAVAAPAAPQASASDPPATPAGSEGPTVKAASQNETATDRAADAAKAKTEGMKISAGMNAGAQAPIQTHSAPPQKLGTPGDRYLFTESPVEYYYYH